jgi:DnaJ-domain-containing protein 1
MKIDFSKDYYSILGVNKNAKEDDLKTAYKKLAKALHPDRAGNDAFFNTYFQSINEAKEVLLDPQSRARFDANFPSQTKRVKIEPENITNELNRIKKQLHHKDQELARSKEEIVSKTMELNTLQNSVQESRIRISELTGQLGQTQKTKGIMSFVLIGVLLTSILTALTLIDKNEPPNILEKKLPFLINHVQFANSTDSANYQTSFKRSSLRYINTKLIVTPILSERDSLRLTIKFINSDGALSKYPSWSEQKFTFEQTILYEPTNAVIHLAGWGNKSKSFFKKGEHAVEVWYHERIIGKGYFKVMD